MTLIIYGVVQTKLVLRLVLSKLVSIWVVLVSVSTIQQGAQSLFPSAWPGLSVAELEHYTYSLQKSEQQNPQKIKYYNHGSLQLTWK